MGWYDIQGSFNCTNSWHCCVQEVGHIAKGMLQNLEVNTSCRHGFTIAVTILIVSIMTITITTKPILILVVVLPLKEPHHLIHSSYSSSPCDLHAWFHTKLLFRDLHQGHRAARRGRRGLCRPWHRAWHFGTVPSTGEAQWGGESQQREHYTTIRHDAAEVETRRDRTHKTLSQMKLWKASFTSCPFICPE